eukprot:8226567-Heterocapsa_arctica.AAC.1
MFGSRLGPPAVAQDAFCVAIERGARRHIRNKRGRGRARMGLGNCRSHQCQPTVYQKTLHHQTLG